MLVEGAVGPFHKHLAGRFLAAMILAVSTAFSFSAFYAPAVNAFLENEPATVVSRQRRNIRTTEVNDGEDRTLSVIPSVAGSISNSLRDTSFLVSFRRRRFSGRTNVAKTFALPNRWQDHVTITCCRHVGPRA
jgi:hypothetical protein